MKLILLVFTYTSLLFSIEIFDVTNNTAKINITNVAIGNSGIIIREIENNSIIVTQAVVSKSNNINSTITFIEKEILPQDAIPTTKIKPRSGDMFILNHLYKTSLLIVPNLSAKKNLLKLYPNQNFLNEDFFAAHLKLTNSPLPSKKIISDFAQSQQIGTIFIVVKNKLYIVDSISFKIISSIDLQYQDTTTNIPFLTKVTDIKTGLWSLGDDKITNYNKYYLNLLEINE